ncbi:MAG: DUF2905 domain-containing protein [Clostridia bacterium]|nr:DUF2905 domain-containing protein [Clostridia bacterium]
MDFFQSFGRTLVVLGLLLAAAGAFLMFGGKIGIGRLPGDVFYRKNNFVFYFPVVSSIVISIILTILLNVLRFRK